MDAFVEYLAGFVGVSGTNFGAFEFYALLTFDRALSSSELDSLFAYYEDVYL